MTPEQKLFYLSLYLGAECEIKRFDYSLSERCQIVEVSIADESISVILKGYDVPETFYLQEFQDIKLILKPVPVELDEPTSSPEGILWLIQNKYDIFNLKSQDLAIYENDLCTK